MKDITAVVLAGGIGKRFVPFLHDKTLFPFMGRSLLERTLAMTHMAGIKQVIIATNPYNHPWLEAHLEQFAPLSITLHLQPEPNGMGGAMLSLKDVLPERDILVMNAGDMVDDHLLPELLIQADQYDAVLTGLETPTYQPVGYFILDNDRVTGIIEKPGADNMPSNLGNLVFHYFSDAKQFVSHIEEIQNSSDPGTDDVYEQALNRVMKESNVGVYRYQGRWQKLKFGYHVLDMVEYLLQDVQRSIDPSATVAPNAVVNGNVVIDAGAKVFDGAIIQGPAYIGKNAVIGNQALVRQSIVEADSTVGFGSEVVRSYVGKKSDLHHAYVGDSVLEEHVHFGYGAHTANYRFDQQAVEMKTRNGNLPTGKTKLGALIARDTELGVNATTLPGVSLGANSLVYPGAVVHEALSDNSMLKYIQTQQVVAKKAA